MEPPPRPDLVRSTDDGRSPGTAVRGGMDVEVQLADGRWDRAEVLAEGLDPRYGWRVLLRWGGGYQAWFIPDPAKIRPVTGPAGSAGPPLPARVLEPARDSIAVCERALPAALILSGAPMGNVQLAGPATGALRIVAQQGFGPSFLDFFSAVEGEESACGQAFQVARPVWVNDVSTSPVFAGTEALRVVLGAGVNTVASVPVLDPGGHVSAVISVHGRDSAGWTAEQQRQLQDLALATGRRLKEARSGAAGSSPHDEDRATS